MSLSANKPVKNLGIVSVNVNYFNNLKMGEFFIYQSKQIFLRYFTKKFIKNKSYLKTILNSPDLLYYSYLNIKEP